MTLASRILAGRPGLLRDGGQERPRSPATPAALAARDKGYDNPRVRRYLRRRGIAARIGRDSSQRLGRHCWAVERTLGWLLS
jgi:hypothetical protein